MEWTASEILEELKKNLRNEDSRIEGSFTMDNLQAVSEVLAMYNGMLIRPLWDEIDKQIEQVVTSGNENHYVFWAKQVEDSSGKKVVGKRRTRRRAGRKKKKSQKRAGHLTKHAEAG